MRHHCLHPFGVHRHSAGQLAAGGQVPHVNTPWSGWVDRKLVSPGSHTVIAGGRLVFLGAAPHHLDGYPLIVSLTDWDCCQVVLDAVSKVSEDLFDAIDRHLHPSGLPARNGRLLDTQLPGKLPLRKAGALSQLLEHSAYLLCLGNNMRCYQWT